ncbi:MAG: HpcH/HpaI aldolase/citrate lyase family protein [Rhodobacteraceae bacterium]|nr:HpcH/HpaI aldolase/citrate lyase family protein [Paracoccaceae bacterium]PHR53616.1 MAG: 2-keto-3-deoxy-L-rhamnonate aldolase [Robiginitomaculum sp.]
MPAPINTFKAALARDAQLIGLWLGLANAYTAEIAALSGFDWLLIDGEHAPNDLRTIMEQLAVMQGYPVAAVVRPPTGDRVLIKQYLDIGVQSFLVPMVESAAQAQEIVRSVCYPPRGVRGVGASLGRASRFNAIGDYQATADAQICVLVQVESRAGIAELDGILAVDGVDGVFIGPADLAADMGFAGDLGAAEVQAVVVDALGRINAAGKASGILSMDPELLRGYRAMGVNFIAVGTDVGALTGGLRALRAQHL